MLASLIFLTVLLPIFHAESTSNSDTSVEYEIVLLSEHYHDNEAFTQGLEMYNGSIYESTGLYGSSSLREVDPWSGQVIRSVALNDTIFSEGITVYNETIIMLTWKSEIAYVFDIKNLTVVSSFSYQGEGWGICYDGEYLIMSNGTSSISIRDPDSFNVLRVITVTDELGNRINKINELECISTAEGSRVLANIWQDDRIVLFDPSNGTLLGDFDASSISEKNSNGINNVLNGIAHHNSSEFWITGKNWSSMYLVSMTNLSGVEKVKCFTVCGQNNNSPLTAISLVLLMTVIFSIAFLYLDQKTRNEKNQEIDESNNRHDELPDGMPASQRRGGDQDD